MTTIEFRVYGIPQTKGSAKGFAVPNKQKPGKFRTIITNDNKKNKPWAQTVSGEAQRHRVDGCPFEGPIVLEMVFLMPIPKSLPKRAPAFMLKKPDVDKMTRSVKDALSGVLYIDDKQVVHTDVKKMYCEAPGVMVRLRHLTLADDPDGAYTYQRGRPTKLF